MMSNVGQQQVIQLGMRLRSIEKGTQEVEDIDENVVLLG
jgi:hypothetical protein